MTQLATTVDKQIDLLRSRGSIIDDLDKAKDILLDVGYYRLGFYLFPFEKTFPNLRERTHEYIEGVSFDDAVKLYYFDFDLRLLLMRYLNRIEGLGGWQHYWRSEYCKVNTSSCFSATSYTPA